MPLGLTLQLDTVSAVSYGSNARDIDVSKKPVIVTPEVLDRRRLI